MVLMYILPVSRVIARIISEKDTRIREYMKVMGLSDLCYWLSWFTYYISISTTISIANTIIICSKILPNSNPFLIFLYLWLYGFSLFGYIVMMQSVFHNVRTGVIISTLVYFLTSFID